MRTVAQLLYVILVANVSALNNGSLREWLLRCSSAGK